MVVGDYVMLREWSVYATGTDRHNPLGVIGVVLSMEVLWNNKKRTKDLPVLVHWGTFKNSYKVRDLEVV